MAWAICLDCGTPINWPKRRFSRLADYKCPRCGGRLKEVPYEVARKRMEEHGGYWSFYVDDWIPNSFWKKEEVKTVG